MKITAWAPLAAMILAGCATPTDLMSLKSPRTYESKQSPKNVANCLARNQLHRYSGDAPTILERPDGTMEVTVIGVMPVVVHFHAIISQTAGGSVIQTWSSSWYQREAVEDEATKGC